MSDSGLALCIIDLCYLCPVVFAKINNLLIFFIHEISCCFFANLIDTLSSHLYFILHFCYSLFEVNALWFLGILNAFDVPAVLNLRNLNIIDLVFLALHSERLSIVETVWLYCLQFLLSLPLTKIGSKFHARYARRMLALVRARWWTFARESIWPRSRSFPMFTLKLISDSLISWDVVLRRRIASKWYPRALFPMDHWGHLLIPKHTQ